VLRLVLHLEKTTAELELALSVLVELVAVELGLSALVLELHQHQL
jgi:hypothetical protein